MLLTILLFIAILLVVVLVHEFGHFLAARKTNMRVDEFGFGFPPRLWRVKKGETLYSFNALPIGGFVKIYGEDPAPESFDFAQDTVEGKHRPEVDFNNDEYRMFRNKPFRQRAAVIIAGVGMNFLLAYILFSIGHIVGTPMVLRDDTPRDRVRNIQVQIVKASEGSPAARAGLRAGDVIKGLSFVGEHEIISTGDSVQKFIEHHAGETVLFEILRDKVVQQFSVAIRKEAPLGQGLTGIEFIEIGLVRYSPYRAFFEGGKTLGSLTYQTLQAFGSTVARALTSGHIPDSISGPVGIAVMTGTVRNLGVAYILQFVALISLSLGTLNILPFPALDGGRLAFLIIEKLKGSAVSQKVERYAHAAGFAFLIALIVVITYKDITRFF